MRIGDLGRTALQAEIVMLKAMALRNARRAAFLVVGLVFGLLTLVAAEIALFFVLHLDAGITPAWSAVIVGGVDLGLAGLLVLAGSAGGPGAVEIEARMTRDRSLGEIRNAMAFATITGPVGRFAGRSAFGFARRRMRRRHR